MMEAGVNEMHRRRIHLTDGRYLIFYTFDNAFGASRDTRPVDRAADFATTSPAEDDAQAEAKVRRED